MNSKIRKSLFTYQVSIVNRILVDSVMHFIQYTGLLFASDFLGLHFIKFIRIFRLRIKSLFSRKFDLKCSCPEFCMGDQKLIHLYKDFSFLRNFTFSAVWDRKISLLAQCYYSEPFRIIFIIAAELYLSSKLQIHAPRFRAKS